MKKQITITQQALDTKLGEARKGGYEIGKREMMYPKNHAQSVAVSKLLDALFEILDERYEYKHEDY